MRLIICQIVWPANPPYFHFLNIVAVDKNTNNAWTALSHFFGWKPRTPSISYFVAKLSICSQKNVLHLRSFAFTLPFALSFALSSCLSFIASRLSVIRESWLILKLYWYLQNGTSAHRNSIPCPSLSATQERLSVRYQWNILVFKYSECTLWVCFDRTILFDLTFVQGRCVHFKFCI